MPASPRLVRARILSVFGLLAAALLVPAPASASCAVLPGSEEQWKTADSVFVGTVIGVENNARWAKVSVEEIWIGPDQAAEVIVRGGSEDAGTASSVDRQYEVGIRYLFAVMVVDGTLQDNACSGTTPVEVIDLDSMRPADSRVPGAAPEAPDPGLDLGGLAAPVLIVSVIGGLLLATVLLARRRAA